MRNEKLGPAVGSTACGVTNATISSLFSLLSSVTRTRRSVEKYLSITEVVNRRQAQQKRKQVSNSVHDDVATQVILD